MLHEGKIIVLRRDQGYLSDPNVEDKKIKSKKIKGCLKKEMTKKREEKKLKILKRIAVLTIESIWWPVTIVDSLRFSGGVLNNKNSEKSDLFKKFLFNCFDDFLDWKHFWSLTTNDLVIIFFQYLYLDKCTISRLLTG